MTGNEDKDKKKDTYNLTKEGWIHLTVIEYMGNIKSRDQEVYLESVTWLQSCDYAYREKFMHI